jgi:hypothetical protein
MQFSAPTAFSNDICLSSPTLFGTTEINGFPKFKAKAVPWKLEVITKLAFWNKSINSGIVELSALIKSIS